MLLSNESLVNINKPKPRTLRYDFQQDADEFWDYNKISSKSYVTRKMLKAVSCSYLQGLSSWLL